MLQLEAINRNFALWQEKLASNGCSVDELVKVYGEQIKVASFGMGNDSGAAYPGAMINTALRKICKYAVNLNKQLPAEIGVDVKSLVKVCLLQHISKALMYRLNDNPNIRSKYLFADNENYVLKGGELSIVMCMRCGIIFDEVEYEAMTILDKEFDQKKEAFTNKLGIIVRLANQMANLELREEKKLIKKNNGKG